jgi:hypothetical protein
MAYAMAKPGAPDSFLKLYRNEKQSMHFVFGAPKNAKTFQLPLIYFRTDLTRVEASRHSAKALSSSLPLPSVRVRDASGRHQNI